MLVIFNFQTKLSLYIIGRSMASPQNRYMLIESSTHVLKYSK